MSSGRPIVPVWIVPFLYAAGAFALGLTIHQIEDRYFPALSAAMSTGSALAIYSSIATGMIALTGIVFSLMFLMVQFSATVYSPRLVLWISRDPLLYHTLGLFTATFLYAIAALAGVDRRNSGRVPVFSVWLLVVLLMASMVFFVLLVKRVGRLEVSRVLHFTGDFGRRAVESVYPVLTRADEETAKAASRIEPLTQQLSYSGPPRVLNTVRVEHLAALAEDSGGYIRLLCSAGDTLVEGTPLLNLYGAGASLNENSLMRAFRTGLERTFEQDPKYAIRLLVDVAIRALSPAVNDPSTAVQALDQIEDLLVRLGRRDLEIGEIRDRAGVVRVLLAVPSWEDFLDLALGEIRCYGAGNLQVARRMQALLHDLAAALPPERHHALTQHRRLLSAATCRSFPEVDDQQTAAAEDREGLGSTRRTERPPWRLAG